MAGVRRRASPDDAAPGVLPVSVIIPAYNRATHLRRCLESVWSQAPALPAEVIVVDDHSSDGTYAVAASSGAHVIRHPENRGAAAARNTGIYAASCEWVAFLDSDDQWLPHHLRHMWRLRDDHALVGTSALYCFDDPARDRVHGPVGRQPIVLRSPRSLIMYNLFAASASMVKRDVAVALGGFHARWGVEDFDLWVRVLERHTAICSPQVTVLYHAHDEQLSLDYERMHRGHREVVEAHLQRAGGSSTALEQWEAVAAWDGMRAALTAKDWEGALRKAPSAVRTPQRLVGLVMLLWTRFLTRRRSVEVGRDGCASIALLVRDVSNHRAVTQVVSGRCVRDLSDRSLPSALVRLVHRPSRVVVTDARWQASLFRRLGARALTADQALGSPNELDDVYAY
jgi:hypothetical protein